MGLQAKAKKSGAFRVLLKKLIEKREGKEEKEEEEKPSRSGFRNANKQLKKLEKKGK